MSRGSQYSHLVFEYMEKRTGMNVYIRDIAQDINITTDQVRRALSYLRRKGAPVEIIQTGQIYRWYPDATAKKQSGGVQEKSGQRIFEEVGTTSQGTVIAKCEDGKLYRLTELDV